MKKIIIYCLILSAVIFGFILAANKSKLRTVASEENSEPAEFSSLTEGQKNKWRLVKTLKFQKKESSIELLTDKLQMICEVSSLIELKFIALNLSVAGSQPSITHTFSCNQIMMKPDQVTLATPVSEFIKMNTIKKVLLDDSSQLTSNLLYSDEAFPNLWRLSEIKISGTYNFTINQYEIEKALSTDFDFEITSVK